MKLCKDDHRSLMRRILHVRQLAERYGLPLLFDGGQLEMFSDGELWAYFYNLSDSTTSWIKTRFWPSDGGFPMLCQCGNSLNGSISFEPIVKSATPSPVRSVSNP